jgi:ABC-type transport system involved in multi-copper enzyme maturation permease subunit
LTRFVVIEFDMSESDFSSSTITISYSDADVLGLDEPFSLFKYLPSSNSFVELTGVFDTHDRTVTFTLTSTDDPLFAIGGSASGSVEPSSTPWVVLGVSVVVIVLLVVVGFWFFKKRSE